MLLRPDRSNDSLVSVMTNSEFDFSASSRVECEMVLSSSRGSPRDSGRWPAAACHLRFSGKCSRARPRSASTCFQQRHQNFVEHAGGVQLARRFEKQCQLFQVVGSSGRWMPEIWLRNSRAVLVVALRIEHYIGDIAHPELHPVVLREFVRSTRSPLTKVPCLLPRRPRRTCRFPRRGSMVAGNPRIAITRSLSALRPTVKGLWSSGMVFWSFPCTKPGWEIHWNRSRAARQWFEKPWRREGLSLQK